MRILLITSYFEPDSGAAAVRLSRLAKALQQRGHEITVLTTMPHYPHGHIADSYRGTFTMTEVRNEVRIIRAWLWATPSPKISRRLISQMSFMLTAVVRGLFLPRPDVVLIEAQPVFTALAGVFLSHLKGVNYVLNISDFWPDHLLSVGLLTETHPLFQFARCIVDRMYHDAAQIVAINKALEQHVRSRITEHDKIHLILNAVDLARFHPGLDGTAFRRKHNLGDCKLISFIGAFATQYDLDTMFAVTRHFEHRYDVRFIFIGGGSRGETFRQRFTEGDLRDSCWIGWLSYDEIPLAWAVSHITYWALRDHTLFRGTLPAKLYEALASGVPVVAASEGLAAEIIGHSGAGVVVGCGDTEGLIKAIERLLVDTDFYHQCSQAGRHYAEEHFDPGPAIVAYENVLLTAT